MEYRRLRLSDLENFYQLRLEALAKAPTAFRSTLEEVRSRGSADFAPMLQSNGSDEVIFGAFEKDVLVGVVGVLRTLRPKTQHRATVWGMYVNAAHQGQGIGGKLLDIAILHAKKEMRAQTVSLTVESSNLSAVRLYESKSFRSWGREPKALFFDGQFFDEINMTLDLTESART